MDPWFSPESASYFSLFSLMSLMALMSHWIRQGKHRHLVVGSFFVSIGVGVALAVAALVAWFAGQPRYVSGALAMTGIVIAIVFLATLPIVYRGYAEADRRRMMARDL